LGHLLLSLAPSWVWPGQRNLEQDLHRKRAQDSEAAQLNHSNLSRRHAINKQELKANLT
jgi:hypothetical protein